LNQELEMVKYTLRSLALSARVAFGIECGVFGVRTRVVTSLDPGLISGTAFGVLDLRLRRLKIRGFMGIPVASHGKLRRAKANKPRMTLKAKNDPPALKLRRGKLGA
jgi:hypothetical protein